MKILEVEQFLTQYKEEMELTDTWYKARMNEVIISNQYEPSSEELVFGARVAWRNSNRCIGRLFWKSLHVFDERDLDEEIEIFKALLRHIKFATNNGKIKPVITVFKPGVVRIWNEQIIRYAGYETEKGVLGDPSSIAITKVCQALGWKGEGTHFDILPIVIQVEGRAPTIFEIPKDYILEVPILHPKYKEFKELNIKWYAVPIISNLKLSIGGVEFQAAPFNGWYMGTEIGARNLADVGRYNMLPKVADLIGLNASSNSSLWKDLALVELNIAVLHSFKEKGVSIVDHHTAVQQFKIFEQQEKESNRQVTGDWKWLIPPMSPATTHIYHQPIANIIKKPNYFYQKAPNYDLFLK